MTNTFESILSDTPLAKRLDRLAELAAAQDRLTHVAVIVTTPRPPDWMEALDAGHAVAVIGDPEDVPAILAALRAGAAPDPRVLVLDLREMASEAALTLVSAVIREVAALGARGDGKTIGAIIAWLLYAFRHAQLGGALPVRVLVATGTMTEHRDKLCRSLIEPLFRGLFQPHDDEHLWIAALGGVELLHLVLFGVKDPTEADKLRQAAHALWIEEAAPAAVEATGGLDEAALGLGITSLRLPSYHHPVLVTSNYGSEGHWSWQRYAVRRVPGTRLIRFPPGERASAADRKTWMEALDGRPDLQRRLVLGEPALIVEGEGVLFDVWNPLTHVSPTPLLPVMGARTVFGHDFGLRPATVVMQEVRGQIRVLASLTTLHGGMAQHIPNIVLPWCAKAMPWLLERGAMLEHRIDPAGLVGDQGDSSSSPYVQLKRRMAGSIRPGAVKWEPRLSPLLGVLGRMVNGRPTLVVDPGPDTQVLREACDGKWFYPRRADGSVVRDLPEKTHPHSDVGDALLYAVAALAPISDPLGRPRSPTRVIGMDFDPRHPFSRVPQRSA